jgi:hypothetical protein
MHHAQKPQPVRFVIWWDQQDIKVPRHARMSLSHSSSHSSSHSRLTLISLSSHSHISHISFTSHSHLTLVSLSSHSHITLISLSSHFSSHSHLTLISLPSHFSSHSHLALISLSSHCYRTHIALSSRSHLTLCLTLISARIAPLFSGGGVGNDNIETPIYINIDYRHRKRSQTHTHARGVALVFFKSSLVDLREIPFSGHWASAAGPCMSNAWALDRGFDV